jgi:hypothetical protein
MIAWELHSSTLNTPHRNIHGPFQPKSFQKAHKNYGKASLIVI